MSTRFITMNYRWCIVLICGIAVQFAIKPTLIHAQQNTISAPAQDSEVKGYQVAPEEIDNLSQVIKQFYSNNKSVIVTSDKSGQLIVVAPAEIQSQVSQILNQSGKLQSGNNPNDSSLKVKQTIPSASATNANHQYSRDLGNGLFETEVKLSNIEWQQIEQGIMQLVGRQLPVTYSAEGAIATLTLPTSGNRKVGMQVYRKDNIIVLRGNPDTVASWSRIIRAMDTPAKDETVRTSLVSLQKAKRTDVQTALKPLADSENSLAKKQVFETLKKVAGEQKLRWSGDLAAMIFQPEAGNENPGTAPNTDEAVANSENQVTIGPDDDSGLIGPVQIEFLEGLDVIVVRGHKRDVERITRIINDIERLSAETQPVIKIRELMHANSEAVYETIIELYEELLSTRYGQVSITPLAKPNAILLIGREQSVAGLEELIDKLDQPVGASDQLKVFQLAHLSAVDAETSLTEFYADPERLAPRVKVAADVRSNSLIVHASPRDMVEVEYLIKQIDIPTSESELELRVFQLKNSLAEDLAPVLQEAISGQSQTGGNNQAAVQARAAMLTFMGVDSKNGQAFKSGILTEVQVTADARSNALLVRAARDSMELIGALIDFLDSQPSAESQLKVFAIINGDAELMVIMLEELFGQDQSNNQNQFGVNISSGESSLIPLAFSVDSRTNSIIASGSASDLVVVEAILLRLDQDEVLERESTVIRLKNARADLVADSLTELLSSESQLQNIDPNSSSPFQQLAREVIVVPELFSNSLIVSATPKYYEEIIRIVEELDARPPMVLIQVLIADVLLDDVEELGFEFGLQDSLLFDRSVVSGGTQTPGFDFNNNPLGNSSDAASLATRATVAAQGLSSFALGRTNSELDYGGLVLSAASESVSILIRALQHERRLEVLARPQIMTMDNQPAFIQVGERVPYITSSQTTNTGIVNTTELVNTGIILSVTPRISPDGMVVMAIQAERSVVGEDEDGIPISINANGDVIRSPRIETQTATTVISARTGQTVVMGGLIDQKTLTISRKVPIIADIPVVGHLFRYDSYAKERNELMIILTPSVINNDEDAAIMREQEMNRMSWCLADVASIHGESALYGVDHSLPSGEGMLEIRPDQAPSAPEELPLAPTIEPLNYQQPVYNNPNAQNYPRQYPVGQPKVVPLQVQPNNAGIRPVGYQQQRPAAQYPVNAYPTQIPVGR
ncbi:MAG: secretin N-terminal domain-containing protein [Pirellulales bacterium]